MLESVLDQCKTQEMRDKAVDNYPHALKYVHSCFKTQDIVTKRLILIRVQYNLKPEYYETQELCDKAVKTCFLHLFLSLIYVSLKKCVAKLFLRFLLC